HPSEPASPAKHPILQPQQRARSTAASQEQQPSPPQPGSTLRPAPALAEPSTPHSQPRSNTPPEHPTQPAHQHPKHPASSPATSHTSSPSAADPSSPQYIAVDK
ncbi:predicted GPI-anchored protein 58, partial [Homalodisca vitripennis]|uniref:predicted GPI-anchored protein 58 n=1 Tax=Homalodisca vitripennis TaxID=197043 RepID=UPI001EECC7BB